MNVHSASEVMPALIGGVEAVRLIGCERPAAWLDGVIREYVDIEWVGEATEAILSETEGLPVMGGLLLDWWSGRDPGAHLAAVQAAGRADLRVLLVTDEPARGWTRAARLALLVKAVEEAAPRIEGDLSRMSIDLMLDRDPIIGLAQAEAFKRMLSPLLGEGDWPRALRDSGQ